MITDRTIGDVNSARSIILNKVQKFLELSEDDLITLERGTILPSTINRIESKQGELLALFEQISYFGSGVIVKSWDDGEEIFKQGDLERIIENGEILRNAFFVYNSSPQKATAKYHYENINKIEKLLFDLQKMYDFVVDNFKECDTFYCGED